MESSFTGISEFNASWIPAVVVPGVQGPNQLVSPSGGGVGEITLKALVAMFVVTILPPRALNVPLNVVKKIASDDVSRTKRTGPKNVTPLTRSVRIA